MNEPGEGFALRVLVVDDCADTRYSLALLLRRWGHEPLAVADGPSALTAAAWFRPHVVLLDLGLPGMDGYQVARLLRRQAGLDRTALLVLSGYGLPEDQGRAREAGCNRHFLKPVEPEELRQELREQSLAIRGRGNGVLPGSGPAPEEIRRND
jgi:CheY-like chemotaxis protein